MRLANAGAELGSNHRGYDGPGGALAGTGQPWCGIEQCGTLQDSGQPGFVACYPETVVYMQI